LFQKTARLSPPSTAVFYGDGLFETLRVANGKPFRWAQHLERLRGGAEYLKIPMPFAAEAWRGFAEELIARNQMREALLRLTLSRGVGARGYSPRDARNPTLLISLHPTPPVASESPAQWRAITSSVRLPTVGLLSQYKTANKLFQVLARAEADAANADEALLLDTNGHAVESSSGNLFWVEAGAVRTAPVGDTILPGVTRTVVLDLCQRLRVPVREDRCTPGQLLQTEGVFVTQTSVGIAEVVSLDGQALGRSPITKQLAGAYADLLRSETR
jgi:aminodeoxychorismate lyase